ncbi:MAG: cell division protein FtsQ/DivIB [Streptosporangiales bacterium]
MSKPLRVISVLAACALVGGWLWVVYGSGVFAATAVEVTGTDRLTEAQVASAAQVPMGTPLARVDVDAVAARVGQLSQVAGVTVHRAWPHTVRVEVRERVPVAAVHRQDRWWLVDRTAVVVATQPQRPEGLPKLAVDRPEPDDPIARTALAVIDSLDGSLRDDLVKVSASSPDGVRLRVVVGSDELGERGSAHRKSGGARGAKFTVVWGNAEHAAKKARVLGALREAKPHADVYDVSTPGVATVRK